MQTGQSSKPAMGALWGWGDVAGRVTGIIRRGWPAAVWIAGFSLVWGNSPLGVGVYHDSLFYMSAASNFARGNGFSWTGSYGVAKPLTHFPPLYPLTLAVLELLGLEVGTAARFVSAALLGLNAALAACIVRSVTRSVICTALTPALFLLPALLVPHLMAMSEPLFYVTSLTSLWLLGRSLHQGSSRGLFLAGLFCCAAVLTRYAGLGLFLTGGVVLLLLSGKGLVARLKDLGVFLGAASFFPCVWLARNYAVAGSLTNRTPRVHLPNLDTVRRYLDVIAAWFTDKYPSHWEVTALLLAWLALLAGASALAQRSRHPEYRAVGLQVAVLLVFWIAYGLSVFLSLSFLDASVRIDDRILSPLLLSGVLATLVAIGAVRSSTYQLAIAGSLVFLGLSGPLPRAFEQSVATLNQVRREGIGFASRQWRDSQVIKWIQASDPQTIIVTNEAMAVQYLSGRAAIQVPDAFDPVTAQPRADYEEAIGELREIIEDQGGYLIVFGGRPLADFHGLQLEVVMMAPDGIIYSAELRR